MTPTELLIILSTAFLGSVGHCVGMCGGIVVAYSSAKIDPDAPLKHQSLMHLAYNMGRVATYTLLGALFGLVGMVIAFTPETKGVLFLLTGILMILAGLSLLGNISFLNSAEFSIAGNGWFQRTFSRLIKSKSLGSFFLLGMLNGLIPCGLVYSFAVFAASTASPLWGALVMFVFGLGTVPTLFLLGNVTRFLQQGALRDVMMKLAAMLVVLYGAMTLHKGYKFIKDPQGMQRMLDSMHQGSIKSKLEGKCGGTMKCAPGKCG